jgi:transcriptional regulator with XRE-family HTH domain
MPQIESPIVQQRRLRAELRRARDNADLTQKGVADELEWSPSKVIRIETGAVSISRSDLMALLQLYGIDDRTRVQELLDMAKASKQQSWWDEYRNDYPQQFLTFLGYEASAARLRQFQALTIPGLLQSPDYARALLSAFSNDSAAVERGLRVRTTRQNLLTQKDGPELLFVLDEAVLRRQVGGAEVWRAQLRRLVELNRRPNIHIQVLPFEVGAHPGMKGSFTVFEFPFDDEDYEADYAVLLEQPQEDLLIQNDSEQASIYVETFVELEGIARPSEEFAATIEELLAGRATSAHEPATA